MGILGWDEICFLGWDEICFLGWDEICFLGRDEIGFRVGWNMCFLVGMKYVFYHRMIKYVFLHIKNTGLHCRCRNNIFSLFIPVNPVRCHKMHRRLTLTKNQKLCKSLFKYIYMSWQTKNIFWFYTKTLLKVQV